eukprot:NODE_14823_length_1083_cov_5.239540.p1 GENE.NODE_14823_length_1083_cov_5.239540~~NODE_14823_length_1083_cov_5.239540.p1  ORF type:complete len:230 (+),score=90.66 NODE_14823_length_1083_cov_5.239540:34-723(+)
MGMALLAVDPRTPALLLLQRLAAPWPWQPCCVELYANSRRLSSGGAPDLEVRRARIALMNAKRMRKAGHIDEKTFQKVQEVARAVIDAAPPPEPEPEVAQRPGLLGFAERGDLYAVRGALASGDSDPDEADKHHTTALLLATRCGHEEVAEALLDGGADVNRTGAWGFTPLMYAAIFHQPNLAQLLLARGADAAPVDARGGTALSHAISEKQPEIERMIRRALGLKDDE